MPPVGNGWKNTVIGVMAAILATGFGSWAAFGVDKVSEDRAKEICEDKVSPVKEDVREIKQTVKEIQTQQTETSGDIKVLLERTAP